MLSLRSDVLTHRTRAQLVGLAGRHQLGGLRDPRCALVAMQENASRRRTMGLPSCDLVADALYGFDGGRHSSYMASASNAGLDARDWLILKELLTQHSLRPQEGDKRGSIGLLRPIKTKGGGSVQGLSVSLPLYNTITADCSERTATVVPHACNTAHPGALKAYHTHKNGTLWNADMREVVRAAGELRTALRNKAPQTELNKIMGSLTSDAERLLVLDVLAPRDKTHAWCTWTTSGTG